MGLGEIRLFAGKRLPQGWAFCDGTRLKAQDYPDLHKLLGGAYGLDNATFALPDLRGRTPTRGKTGTAGSHPTLLDRPNTPPARMELHFMIALTEAAMPDRDDPFIGEIRPFAFMHKMPGWLHCDGQVLPIAEHDPLVNVIEFTFGGDRNSTFGIPDLRGIYPVHASKPQDLGKTSRSQLTDEESSDRSLLGLNYCIATWGRYPG